MVPRNVIFKNITCYIKVHFWHSTVGIDCIPLEDSTGNHARVGGPDSCRVKPHTKPWTVRLPWKDSPNADIHHEDTPKCGGTLIAKNLVLSAAHCFCPPIPNPTADDCIGWKNVKALVGEHEIRNKEDQQIIGIKDMIMNPNYTGVKSMYEYWPTTWL